MSNQKVPIGDVTRWLSGGTPNRSVTSYWEGDIPWISASTLKKSEISESDQHLTPEAVSLGSKMAPVGSTLFLVRGSALYNEIRAGLVVSPVCFNQDVKALVPASEVEPKFLTYSLLGREQDLLKLVSTAGNSAGVLDTKLVQSFKIYLPEPVEQHAIAESLSDVDGLVGALEKLIAKKRAIKQATMQQLLTGKTRLPGFTGKWETKRLGDLGAFLKGSGVRRDEAQSGDLPCIRYGEIYTHHNDYIKSFNSWISPTVAESAAQLKKGDLLFAGSGETKEEIGKCVAFIGENEAFGGGDIVILRARDVDPVFMGYYCNTDQINAQKSSKGQGDAVVHISASALATIEIKLPRLEEQSSIATVLLEMDAEIEVLERRRDKTRQIKQGMMQQLLTGRIRLIKPQASSVQGGTKSKESKPHSWAFNEAVVISTLAKHFGKEEFPLGRKRYTKLSYLLHRHAEKQTEGYLKKAAGPYNPKTKYGGPERIALESNYVREHKHGPYSGFVAAGNISQAEDYFEKWYGKDSIHWLEKFRYKKNEDLELLATVDMAAEELNATRKDVDVAGVKDVICSHPEWRTKLDRDTFSEANIAKAIETRRGLFGGGVET